MLQRGLTSPMVADQRRENEKTRRKNEKVVKNRREVEIGVVEEGLEEKCNGKFLIK